MVAAMEEVLEEAMRVRGLVVEEEEEAAALLLRMAPALHASRHVGAS